MDLIDRQAAIDYIDRAITAWSEDKEIAIDCLRNLPSVQPELATNLQQTCNQLATDTISRQALIDVLHTYFKDGFDEDRWWNSTHILTAIRALPSAEPEIIRCKDCKHYVVHTLFGHSQGWCERLCDEFDKSLARGTEEDDFCSRAERRTDE